MKSIKMLCGCMGDLGASPGDVLSVPDDCSEKLARDLLARGMATPCKAPKAEKPKASKEDKD